MNIILFIHSTLDGHLTCFQLETIINYVATKLFHVFLHSGVQVPLGHIPKNGAAGVQGMFIFSQYLTK